MRSGIIVACLLAAGCGLQQKEVHKIMLVRAVQPGAWAGLQKPVSVHVASNGDVFIADNGDISFHVFDNDGLPIRHFGRRGEGPGEFRSIRNFVLSGDGIEVFDANGTGFTRLSLDGDFISRVNLDANGDEIVARLGTDRLVLASSARWSIPSASRTSPWPLARLYTIQGEFVADIGHRKVVKSPFAAHIVNFVLPTGSRDGQYLWLAFMNDPEVLLFSLKDGSERTFDRKIPFKWRAIPPDFLPTAAKMAPGKKYVPPFDVVTSAITTDDSGRAYVLTATAPDSGNLPGSPTMIIDVIDPLADAAQHRYEISGTFTHLGVSPDGRKVYVLNSLTGDMASFTGME